MSENSNESLKQLNEIRSLMERSSRFISLSGLSGVFAGITALIGAFIANNYIQKNFEGSIELLNPRGRFESQKIIDAIIYLGTVGTLILVVSIFGGIFFTIRKAKQNGQSIWDATSFRMILNLIIPLGSGGLFCLVLMYYGMIILVAPTTLIFYGLALIHGSKYTLNDIRYLGVLQILLGFVGCALPGHGIIIWSIGFGILHIIYGTHMYLKYERK